MARCTHLDSVNVTELPAAADGCVDCLAAGAGAWVHLRLCLTCGHVGCCDSSKNKHASTHAGEAGHPIVRSAEEGETWCWCYSDKVMFEL
jgi:uncharacterized UBP type Zn finger protein